MWMSSHMSAGPAFQGFVSRDEEILERNDIGMETAEIHSMSMEYFTYGWMEKFFGDRSADYLQMHLEDSAGFRSVRLYG